MPKTTAKSLNWQLLSDAGVLVVGRRKIIKRMKSQGNYIGPYWSNGKVQSSVRYGGKKPINQLDALARIHDTVYAQYKDRKHREAADLWFAAEAYKLKEKFPDLAADIVVYGNFLQRQASETYESVSAGASAGGLFGAALGLVYQVAKNVVTMQQRLNGTYLKSEMADVLKVIENDPYKFSNTIGDVDGGRLNNVNGKSSGRVNSPSDRVPTTDSVYDPPQTDSGSKLLNTYDETSEVVLNARKDWTQEDWDNEFMFSSSNRKQAWLAKHPKVDEVRPIEPVYTGEDDVLPFWDEPYHQPQEHIATLMDMLKARDKQTAYSAAVYRANVQYAQQLARVKPKKQRKPNVGKAYVDLRERSKARHAHNKVAHFGW